MRSGFPLEPSPRIAATKISCTRFAVGHKCIGTDIKTSENILKIALEIEAVLNDYPFSTPNHFIPQRIRFLAAKLNAFDHYAAEKAYKIAERADSFYSARKHAKYPGGAEALWSEMTFDLLGRIKSQAQVRKDHGD